MTNPYPRGSLWRKWDLHVHAPGGKMSDGYSTKDGEPDVEQFCRTVHESDVAVVAVTDYFSLDSYFVVREKYEELFPDDDKLLLPNLELRLPVAVNRDGQNVNLHLVFRPTLTKEEADKFLGHLKTEGTTGDTRTRTTCKDLSTLQQLESATVSVESIESAIRETFGEHAVHRGERLHHLLVIASAKGDGIRVGGNSGIQRKNLLSDEIDKYSDGFYANSGSRDYFLNVDRLEGDAVAVPKPVFDGCDAHTFDDLNAGLGKYNTNSGSHRNITWIKADPSYVGLLQTLIEPSERVAIQATEPDQKEPYKIINRVTFTGTSDFPAEILFNRNLNAVIGSRSSGKSALLAFIAHAVDPVETVRIQTETAGLRDESSAGPAAGFTWGDVADVTCQVEWDSGPDTAGKVIYIPQNSLYTLSEQPDEITKKIAPALFRIYPNVKTAFDSAMSKVDVANSAIRTAVDEWFSLADRIEKQAREIRDLGDKSAITMERDRQQREVDRIKAAAKLTDDEVTRYQEIERRLESAANRLAEIGIERDKFSAFVTFPSGASDATVIPESVHATVAVRPSAIEIPEKVALQIEGLKTAAVNELVASVETLLVQAATALEAEQAALATELESLKTDNADLIAKHEANEELASVVSEHKKQVATLDEIAKREGTHAKLVVDQESAVTRIAEGIRDRDTALGALEAVFNTERRRLADLRSASRRL